LGCSLRDGKVLWYQPTVLGYSRPNVHDGGLYGQSAAEPDHFIAIDEATGQIIYDTHHPELKSAIWPAPGAFHQNRLAIGMESGYLAVFDILDGSLVWLYTQSYGMGETVELDGRLGVSSDDGCLLVFEDEGQMAGVPAHRAATKTSVARKR
jgi:outer membrane protein assembly factor BamB